MPDYDLNQAWVSPSNVGGWHGVNEINNPNIDGWPGGNDFSHPNAAGWSMNPNWDGHQISGWHANDWDGYMDDGWDGVGINPPNPTGWHMENDWNMMPNGGPVLAAHMEKGMDHLIQMIADCGLMCEQTAAYLLEKEDLNARRQQLRSLHDCASICALTACLLARNSPFAREALHMCARVCDACSRECRRFKDRWSQECGRMCNECARMCRMHAK